MQPIKNVILFCALALGLASCTESNVPKRTDTLTAGNILITVDETYKPIIEQELSVFDSSYPDAHIKVQYKPEAECIKDFLNDSVRLILITRELTAEEKTQLEQNKIITEALPIAKDAVAVITNNGSTDSTFSLNQLRGILTGKYNKEYTVVFDNQGSSTLRFMIDSILNGEQLGKNVYAANSNDSVINYVKQNPNAIGFVGVSYASDFEDSTGLNFINTVRIAAIYNDSLQKYYQPYQAFIAPNKYPLTRNLYYIHKDTYPGLAAGFAKFLREQRGQLIFKSARLFPLRVNIIFREAAVNQ